jgi:hypothetical protein
MLFREIIAVYCENHTEHTNTLCGQNVRSTILDSALHGGEWLALRPGRFTSGETAHGVHLIGGWWTQSGRYGAEINLCPFWESSPGRPVRSPSLYQMNSAGACHYVLYNLFSVVYRIRRNNIKN